jgi:hypothetical protein
MRTPESNRLLQITSAFVKIGAAFKAAFSFGDKGEGSFKKVLVNH